MKIKTHFAFFIIAFGIISFSFIEDGVKKLIPGVGVTGEIVIGKTTKEDLVKTYGSDFTDKTYYTNKGDDSIPYSVARHFENKGVTAWFKVGATEVFSIYFHKNYASVTEKGIRAGVSTMNDVVKAYGKSEWLSNRNSMFFEYDGISFHTHFNGKYPVKKSAKKKMMKSKVEYISIKAKEE
jgi:hypothetical protein